ncbi:DUF1905 domain-containing protein [Actinocrispum sp. NPDC049592]|uniref:DUF1905 domain-containing protein n=1 Tax=Actinocrispum sp. NPDC049592 TaxID=3154835 RepID=UPI003415D61C
MVFVFDAELWLWDARRMDTWTFVTVPAEASEQIRELAAGLPRGFGSVRVEVTMGGTTWKTSIFPGSGADGCYVLPVKKAVRKAEQIDVGDVTTTEIALIDL